MNVAGACNAVRRLPDGRLVGDMFDGEGFVRGLQRKGLELARRARAGGRQRRRGLGHRGVAGRRGRGRASRCTTCNAGAAEALAGRLRHALSRRWHVRTGSNDPAGFDLVVNATPLGMNAGDPLPIDVSRLEPRTFVGEVVMKTEMPRPSCRPRRRAAARVQVGTDMLFEMIPPYLEFFGFPTTTPETLRSVARLQY